MQCRICLILLRTLSSTKKVSCIRFTSYFIATCLCLYFPHTGGVFSAHRGGIFRTQGGCVSRTLSLLHRLLTLFLAASDRSNLCFFFEFYFCKVLLSILFSLLVDSVACVYDHTVVVR